jgi:hypothetical protein
MFGMFKVEGRQEPQIERLRALINGQPALQQMGDLVLALEEVQEWIRKIYYGYNFIPDMGNSWKTAKEILYYLLPDTSTGKTTHDEHSYRT